MGWYLKVFKKTVVLIGLATAFSFTSLVVAYPVTVKLSTDAEWLSEGSGVLLSTDKGYVYIFNENMKEFGGAEKDECYVLEADTEDFVTLHENKYPSLKALELQREVSSWKKFNCEPIASIISKSALSEPDFTKLEDWKLEVINDEYMADGFDKIVAENDKYFVIYQNAGTSCAAGIHWLFNKEYKTYLPVDSGTCDDRDFEVILNAEQLIFMSGDRLTALYPIY